MFRGRRHFCNGNKLWKTSQLSFRSQLFVIEEVFLQNILYFILMLGCVRERSLLELSMWFQSTFRYLAMVTFLLFSFQVQLIEHHCFSPGGCDRISMECIASSYSGFAWLHRIGGLPSRVRKVEVLGSTLHLNVMWCSYIRWNRVVVYKIWYFNRIQCSILTWLQLMIVYHWYSAFDLWIEWISQLTLLQILYWFCDIGCWLFGTCRYLSALISQSFLDIGSVSRILDGIMKLCLQFCWNIENRESSANTVELEHITEVIIKFSTILQCISL